VKILAFTFYEAIDTYGGILPPWLGPARDMLRYDTAFMNPKFPDTVLFIKFSTGKLGTFGGTPTLGRWRSFGIALRKLSSPETDGMFRITSMSEEWVTWQHPKDDQGVPDYRALTAVPLSQFLKSKDIP
jgi:hypothetical protein